MGDLSEHFSRSEFACKCGCGFDRPSPVLIQALEGVRTFFNRSVHINSGCRCQKHNDAQAGAAKDSQHVKGNAADITVLGISPDRVWAHLNETHLGGLGRYNTFTHVDVRGHTARWDYRKKK